MRRPSRRAFAAGTIAWALAGAPARAQQGPIGPCSPFRAHDGDVPSEMPGCARRLRPAPGSLGDELEFRRAREGLDEDASPDDDATAVPRRKRRRPAR